MEQSVVCAGPGVTDTIERRHRTIRTAVLDRMLEDLEIVFSHGLFIRPSRNTIRIAVGLLIVESEVLHEGDHTFASGTGDDFTDHLARKSRIFGIVFEVTSRERRTMDISTRSIPSSDMSPKTIFTDKFALTLGKILIPSCTDHRFGSKGDLEFTGKRL